MTAPFYLDANEWPALTTLTEQAADGDSSLELSEVETVSQVVMQPATRLLEPPASPTGSLKLAKHISLLACTMHPSCMMTVFASEIGVCAVSIVRMADQSARQTAKGWQSLGGALVVCEGSL